MKTSLPCALALAVTLAAVLPGQDYPDPAKLAFKDGVDRIPAHAMYKKRSYQGPDVMIDTGLRGIEYVKYQFEKLDTDKPLLYFLNTVTHRSHPGFMRTVGIGRGRGRGFGPRRGMR
ncbi:MAG: hypothetical protein GY953_23145, partial [bacterium]|nr:hypothetical protein [bacterium]